MLLTPQVRFEFGEFRMDPGERSLTMGGHEVSITPKVFDALLLLVENAGMLVTRATFRSALWQDVVVDDANLARVIADLRKALGDVGGARRFIETVPKFGYRFIAPVERIPATAVPDAAKAVVPAPAPSPALVSPPGRNRWFAWVALPVLCAGALGLTVVPGHRETPSDVHSVLITPFKILGTAPDAATLEAGLRDSLAMELGALSNLVVRESAEGKPDADAVLMGAIQFAPNRIHVNARLVSKATGRTRWTGQFDAPSDDILRVEASLARQTANALVSSISPEYLARLERRIPTSPAAYRDYVLGRHYWNQRDPAGYQSALAMFQRSAAADPDFAAAYTGIADTYLLLGGSIRDSLPIIDAALRKAVELDPDFGEAHATMGLLAESQHLDWSEAETQFRTAIRLSPKYATAHHWYAEYLSMMGKYDLSKAEFDVARELDPVSPIIVVDLAQSYNFHKEYRRSLEVLDEALRLDPGFHVAHDRKGYALMLLHRPEEALREFDIGARDGKKPMAVEVQAWAESIEGNLRRARELADSVKPEDADLLLLAGVWANLGDADRAVRCLEDAYRERRPGIVSIKVNPIFDPLRTHPRFQALLKTMHLS